MRRMKIAMVVAFIPFPTDVLAQRIGDGVDAPLAAVLYGATLTVMSVMFSVLRRYASSRDGHLFRPDVETGLRRPALAQRVAPLVYLAITLTGLLDPRIPLALFVGYGLYWSLPVSTRYRAATQQA
jgi:hypothetical protein